MDIRHIRPAWVEVDLDVFEENLRSVQRAVGSKCGVMAIVKADGYGHGAIECARISEESGCRALGVATTGEALELRQAGITMPILQLGFTSAEQAEVTVANDIEATVYNIDIVRALSRAATKLGRPAKVHLKIDSGMNRLGLRPGRDLERFVKDLPSLPNIHIVGAFTHFASSDGDKDFTRQQFSEYRSALATLASLGITNIMKHAANSAGITDFPETHLDMVRPGIIIYGYYPSDSVNKSTAPVVPPLSLKARISHVHVAHPGETIGYGRTYNAQAETVVATLPIGYADGYNRSLSNRGSVLVKGHRVPIIGRVCMDQMMVDVTSVSAVDVGDEVVLIGHQGDEVITADDLALMVGTISHEILTRLGLRLPRVYHRRGQRFMVDRLTGERASIEG
jgi:alanine racemase